MIIKRQLLTFGGLLILEKTGVRLLGMILWRSGLGGISLLILILVSKGLIHGLILCKLFIELRPFGVVSFSDIIRVGLNDRMIHGGVNDIGMRGGGLTEEPSSFEIFCGGLFVVGVWVLCEFEGVVDDDGEFFVKILG